MGRVRRSLTYANVTATAALFMALGGGAYAAIKLPANSVGSKQLKKGAVTPPKVARSTIRLFRGQTGPVGPQGAAGAQGPKGDTGGPGAKGDSGSPAGSALIGRVNGVPADVSPSTELFSFGAISGSAASSPTRTAVEQQSPNKDMVATNLSIFQTNTPTGGNRTFTVSVNGADTALSCQPPSGGAGCTSDAQVAIPANSAIVLKIRGFTETLQNSSTDVRVALRLLTP